MGAGAPKAGEHKREAGGEARRTGGCGGNSGAHTDCGVQARQSAVRTLRNKLHRNTRPRAEGQDTVVLRREQGAGSMDDARGYNELR